MTNTTDKRTLRRGRLLVQLDRSQVFPNDPGQGTPAIVRCFEYSATYWCALDNGLMAPDGRQLLLTDAECDWLYDIDREVTEFLYGDRPV